MRTCIEYRARQRLTAKYAASVTGMKQKTKMYELKSIPGQTDALFI
jgi:hypothetical protein